MKNKEDELISALFRARSINDNKVDPGPDWAEPDLVVDLLQWFAIGFVFYCFLAS